ncbi:hypothetical protein CH063_09987 [Colletotrichum higginsianum]|uniref:Cytidyltransferase-like domain-containing protein n=1 Tax=Colletotrichum higginsianum (strain IMI 349063) TaxID=759273 RepID=H1VFP7_COLHI|nr:hypothetical protein CH63R_03906 [Colletotrichum higginsianum IMI 349063]OBR11610.1 hypothetical protein CH63R_03906 [Colletotrichum higginsianum IMI 349063]CCF39050.1 hypothetical protein CH063_09987 [Colletotrichum higginsianum]
MKGQTAELSKYFASYHRWECPEARTSSTHCQIFGTKDGPLLRKGQTNRVLFYAGCFNPPHIGHLSFLQRAFGGTHDINVIAAVILPLDSHSLRSKRRVNGQDLILSKPDRVRLWRSDARMLPEWWVYDGTVDEWDIMRDKVEEAIERDGFDFQFVVMSGPDHISRFRTYSGWSWSCFETVTSDAGRHSDLVKPDGSLYTLSDRKNARRLAKNPLQVLKVKVCRLKWSKLWVRFVPADGEPLDISSTQIRDIMEGGKLSLDELHERLKGMALSPEVLTEILARQSSRDVSRNWL